MIKNKNQTAVINILNLHIFWLRIDFSTVTFENACRTYETYVYHYCLFVIFDQEQFNSFDVTGLY